VLVVDDSYVCRQQLVELLEVDGDIKVVGEAGTGHEAVDQVRALKPDVTTMDVQMPGLGGLEAIEQIMAKTPVPILVVTGRPSGPHGDLAFEAVRRGALDLLQKPEPDDARAAEQLRSFVRRFAEVRVVKHVAGRLQEIAAQTVEPPASSKPGRSPRVVSRAVAKVPARAPSRPGSTPLTVIGVGASAGGPSTLAAVLSEVPSHIHAAIAVVQHLPSGFTDSFAEYLTRTVSLPVRVVRSKSRLEPGVVYLATDDHHLVVTSPETIAVVNGPRVAGHRPSVTALFSSLAEVLGAQAIGVVLTGMGNDGAQGLRKMRAAGAHTIAQDEATSIVYGMPKAAVEAGGVKTVLSVDQVAPVLVALVSSPRTSPVVHGRQT
jgi:two-component system chemotaxis response regulator CheB